MGKPLLGILYFSSLVGGIACVLLMLYNFFAMLGCVKPEKKNVLPFLGPFALFMPQLWTEHGNKARKQVLLFAILLAICFGSAVLLTSLVPS